MIGRSTRRAQRGQGLLLLMLVMLVAGASVLLEGIGSRASIRASDDEGTTRALALAKEALIAWAVTHPDTPGRLPFPDRGTDASGFNGLSDCVVTSPTDPPISSNRPHLLVGQFPWLGDEGEDDGADDDTTGEGSGCFSLIETWQLLHPLMDATGQNLWYAVSDKLVYNGTGEPAINLGLLDPGGIGSWLTVVDQAGRIISDRVAAVVIASGEVGECQNRDLPIDHDDYPAQFLDQITIGGVTHSNDDVSSPFVVAPVMTMSPNASCDDNPPPSVYNDRLVYITADELLRAVEQRVLGEVAIVLREYRQENGAYPWLSPFRNPLQGHPDAFDGVPGTRVGHLAATDPSDSVPATRQVLDSGFTISWDSNGVSPTNDFPLLGPLVSDLVDEILAAVELEFQALEESNYAFPTSTMETSGDPGCVWHGNDAIVDCFGTANPAPYVLTLSLPIFGVPISLPVFVEREYVFDVAYTGEIKEEQEAGAPVRFSRIRNVSSGAEYSEFERDPPRPSTISVRHYVSDEFAVLPIIELLVPGIGDLLRQISVTRTLTLQTLSPANVIVDGIYLESSTTGPRNPGDLPTWFYENQWERYILVKYAEDVLPRDGLSTAPPSPPCAPGESDCVIISVVNGVGTTTYDDAGAVVIGAGAQLGSQARDPASAQMLDFFENILLNANPSLDPTPAAAERRARSANFNDQIRVVEPPPTLPVPPVALPPIAAPS